MKLISLRKNGLLFNVVLLIVLFVVCVGEVFAWFAMNKSVTASGMTISVAGDSSDVGGNMTITPEGGEPTDNIKLLPGSQMVFDVSVENTNGADAFFYLSIKSLSLRYPVNYAASIYGSQRYEHYTDGDMTNYSYYYSNVLSGSDQATLFQNFVKPMTNAIKYAIYMGTAPDKATLDTFTDYTPPVSETQVSTYINYVNQCANYDSTTTYAYVHAIPNATPDATGSYIDTDGRLFIPNGATFSLKLLLYFDPLITTEYVVTEDVEKYELPNSNGFSSQQLYIDFKLFLVENAPVTP